MEPLIFRGIYQERVWGGRKIESLLGRELPGRTLIGESWDIADRDDALSVVLEGKNRGKTLRNLLREYPEEIMGPGWKPNQRFPLLVKWLDCRERLSIQVHPTAEAAKTLGGEPKTEVWYVLDKEKEANLYIGLKPGVNRAQFEKAIQEGGLEECLQVEKSQIGKTYFIPSGTVHAIGEGNLILEIQENSDTTYRVYDWGRLGLDGKNRELHIQESLRSIDFEGEKKAKGNFQNAKNEPFKVREIKLSPKQTFEIKAGEGPAIISLVSEGVKVKWSNGEMIRSFGDNVLLPYAETFGLEASRETTILVTDHFN